MKKMKLVDRRLSTREKVLVSGLVVLVVLIAWYFLIYNTTGNAIRAYRSQLSTLQEEIDVQEMQAVQLAKMKKVVEEGQKGNVSEIAVYNNLKSEVKALDDILGKAETYNLTFADPVLSGTTVRRVVSVSFTATDYDKAAAIVQDLTECEYRSLITDLSVNVAGLSSYSSSLSGASCSVSLTLTFYETTVGAESTKGLIQETTTTESSDEDSTEN